MTDALLSGPRGREVATVLVAIGRERASRLLSRFEPEEVAQLRLIGEGSGTRRLPNISATELTQITERFAETFERGPGVVGAGSSFEEILAETVPEPEPARPARETAMRPEPDAAERKRRWLAIAEAPEGELATWLTEENEAVAALVIARLPPSLSAALLTQLSPETCSGIVGALPHADATPEAEDLVLDLLEGELADGAGADGAGEKPSLLADIVNELEPDMGERVTKRLADTLSPQQMSAVSSRIFRFEDIARLPAAGRSALLGEMPADRIVLALDGATGELREAVLSSLGQRMRRMVESELEAGLPARPDAVKGARRDVASTAIRMAGDGMFELPSAA